MADQLTFAAMAWQSKGKTTRRERFLAEMNAGVPWASLVVIIEPHDPNAGNGTQPYPLELMLRIHCLQHWFNLSDPAAEEALYDSEAMRRFESVPLADACQRRARLPGRKVSMAIRESTIAGAGEESHAWVCRLRSRQSVPTAPSAVPAGLPAVSDLSGS